MSFESKQPALFSTFVMGLASAALIEMGVIEDPISKTKKKNMNHAKQNIDLLVMMAEKTKGNLSTDEKELIEKVVTDLKLQFAKINTEK